MQASYDCPECNQAAFIVIVHPDILRCLHCGCEWRFVLPPPEAGEARPRARGEAPGSPEDAALKPRLRFF
jgi:hypothetical protein